MITLDQLVILKAGTTIYVAASGRGPKELWANNLCEETFMELERTRSGYHVITQAGGYSFLSLRNGEALFFTKEDAQDYMKELHEEKWIRKAQKLEKQIWENNEELLRMYYHGPGEPDYVCHERADSGLAQED